MAEDGRFSPAGRFLVLAAALVVLVWGMHAAADKVVIVLLAVFLAVISAPPLSWLGKRGVSKGVALLLVLTSVLLAGLVFSSIVAGSINNFREAVPKYRGSLEKKQSRLESWYRESREGAPDWLRDLLPKDNTDTEAGTETGTETGTEAGTEAGTGTETGTVDEDAKRTLGWSDLGIVLDLVTDTLAHIGGLLANALLIFLILVFLCLETSSFPGKIRSTLAEPDRILAGLDGFLHNLNRYMAIKTWISLATGLVAGTWCAVIGVDNPVLWGLLAFLLNYVPNIGSIMAAIPPVLLAYIQYDWPQALYVAAGFGVVNIVMGNVVEPKFMGRGLDMSTLVVFLSLVFWGWVLGPVGMLLSIPLTMTVKIALEMQEETRWLAVWMGAERTAVNDESSPNEA